MDLLIRLWEMRRLDLAVETLVIEVRYRELFTEEEVGVAEKRLKSMSTRRYVCR